MKKIKITYYVFTVLLSMMMLMGAYMELSGNQGAKDVIVGLGYPVYLVGILGVAKLMGVVGIWQNKVKFLREWAYAGFAIDVTGALASHLSQGDGVEKYIAAVIGMVLVAGSYWAFKKLEANS